MFVSRFLIFYPLLTVLAYKSQNKNNSVFPKLCNQARSLSLFRWRTLYSAENIKRLCVFMFQTCSNSLLCTDLQYSSQQLTIGASLKHKNTQHLYIFNRENPQDSEPQNGPRRGLDFIALNDLTLNLQDISEVSKIKTKKSRLTDELQSSQLIKVADNCHMNFMKMRN